MEPGFKFCTNCGAQVRADARFCTSCGAKCDIVSQAPAAPTPQQKLLQGRQMLERREYVPALQLFEEAAAAGTAGAVQWEAVAHLYLSIQFLRQDAEKALAAAQ